MVNRWIVTYTYAWSYAIQTSAEMLKDTPTRLVEFLEEAKLSLLSGTLCLCISCQFRESKCDMTKCLDVWLIHLPPHTFSSCFCQSQCPPTPHLQQGRGTTLQRRMQPRHGWLAALTEQAQAERWNGYGIGVEGRGWWRERQVDGNAC